MGDISGDPIVSAVVITEVKDETPDSVIDNKLADYYNKTLPNTTMKPLSFDLDDEDDKAKELGVATAEIKHRYRVTSRFRSESRSSSFESSSTTSTSTSSSSSGGVSGIIGGAGVSTIGTLAPNLKLPSINEARQMRVTQQVTSPIHLKVITSRNRIHMQHVRSIQEYRSKM